MGIRVAVWGTGNVGRPAIRAVMSHRNMELAAVIVANPDKAGRDIGELCGSEPTDLKATTDWQSVLDSNIDAVVYTATADTRPEEAWSDLQACLRAGCNVVSTSFYSFLHPGSAPDDMVSAISSLCAEGGNSLLVSGVDPGWAMDQLPVMLSGAVAGIREIRTREIFNYALYDQPGVVREVIGLGGSMDETPMMLHDFAIEYVWAPMLRLVGEALGKPVETISVSVEKRSLDRTINVPGMGQFDEGTMGAFRFVVTGSHGGAALYALEHITRIDDDCAPDWPYPPQGRGCHQVLISGNPDLTVTLHAADHFDPGAGGGGNATAANWIVNAIPGVCAAPAGIVTTFDIPAINGAAQLE